MRFKEYKNGGGIDPNYYSRLSEIESNNNPQARSKTSSASGKFQFIKSTWEGLTKKYGLPYNLEDRFDPEKSKKVAELYTQENANYLKSKLGITPTNTDLYAAHFMGVGGASKLLSTLKQNPNASAYDVASPAQIAANKSIFLRKDGSIKTAKEVYDTLNYKVTKNKPQQEVNIAEAKTQPNDPYQFREIKSTDYYAPQVSQNIISLDNTQETTNLAEDKAAEIKNRLDQKKAEKAFIEQMIKATQVAYVNPEDYQSKPTFEEPQEQMFQQGGISQFKKQPFQLKDERVTASKDNTRVSNYNDARLFNTNVRNKTDKEIAQEREARIQASIEAQKTPYTKENWRQQLAAETAATGDKLRVSNSPNFFDDYLNPAVMIGDMASNLGQAPYQAQQSDSALPYVTAIGVPLFMGAVGGLGAKTTGQFVNNMANPLAGTGDLVNNLGNKYLPNAYKLNPKAFKTSTDKFYRQVDNTTYNEGIESGLIKGKQDVDMTRGEGIVNLNKAFGDDAYYNKGSLYYKNNKDLPYLFEAGLPEDRFIPKVNGRTRKFTTENTSVRVSREPIPINDPNITSYKKDWLQGYKKMPTQQGNSIAKNTASGLDELSMPNGGDFKSEINWGNWNKEIPENNQLIKEYNTIEETSKSNGSWMKNLDGSEFKGTPEQFIQQNSENFKKAFPNPILDEVGEVQYNYHGSPSKLDFFDESKSKGVMFGKGVYTTPDKSLGEKYIQNNSDGNFYELYINSNKPQNTITAKDFPDYKKEQSKLMSDYRNADNETLKENIHVKIKELDNDWRIKYNENIKQQDLKEGFDYLRVGDNQVTPFNNFLKSSKNNNGMFDMTNPNIYKSVIPIAGATYLANQNSNEFQQGGQIPVSSQGVYDYPNQEVLVPTQDGRITMKNIDYPILGISQETGQRQMMFPNKEYFFSDTKNVHEVPQQFQQGGTVSEQYEQKTGKPWRTARQEGLTDGSAEQNLELLRNLGGNSQKNISQEYLNQPINFNEAFKQARQTLGANKIFEYQGKKYGTNIQGEKFTPTDEDIVANNLPVKSTKNRLDKQNNEVGSLYTTKKTVKLTPQYEDWEKIKRRNDEINSSDNASKIIKFQTNKPNEKYIVVDKKSGKMHLYQGSREISSYNVGTGENEGDEQTRTWVDKETKKVDWSKGNKQTGAGTYTITGSTEKNKHYGNAPSFNMQNEYGIEVPMAIHAASQSRVAKISDNNPNNNRVSNGCVNGLCNDLRDLYKQGIESGTKVYVLPDNKDNEYVYENGQLNFKSKNSDVNRTVKTLKYKPVKMGLDETKFKEKVFQWNDLNDEEEFNKVTKPFVKALQDNKQSVMKAAKINGDVYNEIAKVAFGIYGTESNFGDTHSAVGNLFRAANKFIDKKSSSSPDYKSKESTYGASEANNSVGLTQIRFSYLNADEKNALKEVGITNNKDFLDPKKAAIGTAVVLGIRYNQQLTPKEKKDILTNLPKKWNNRGNYSDRVKNNSSYLKISQLE